MFQKIIFLILITSCSHKAPFSTEETANFSKGEVILSSSLLINIHDGLMPYLDCVPDRKEAELLLRVIRPRLDEVDITLDKKIANQSTREVLFSECTDNCTCAYLDQMLKENKTALFKEEKVQWNKIYNDFKSHREAQCLSYIQSSFCESPLYSEIENEKSDFIVPE
jgi:hypothetical protein